MRRGRCAAQQVVGRLNSLCDTASARARSKSFPPCDVHYPNVAYRARVEGMAPMPTARNSWTARSRTARSFATTGNHVSSGWQSIAGLIVEKQV